MAKLILNEVEAKEVIALNFARFIEVSWVTTIRDGYNVGKGVTPDEYFSWTDDPKKQGQTYLTYTESCYNDQSQLDWVLDMMPSVIGAGYTVRLED